MSRRDRTRRRNRSKGGAGRILILALGVLVATLTIGVLSAVGYVVSIANSAPGLGTLKAKDQGQNSSIYAADGSPLGVIQAPVLRRPIASTAIPQALKDATVAIEDKRFYRHQGVDFEGVVRAALKNARSGKTVQGGSTLTMQLIKNIYSQDATRDYKRKIREAKLAEELENAHPGAAGKQWILVKYLNNVPYGTVGGQEAVGVWSAAKVFFNKRPSALTLPESALLAGLPQAPTSYNPRLNPEGALRRRNDVLGQMRQAGYITARQETAAAASPLGLENTKYYTQRREKYFFEYVQRELVKTYGKSKVKEGGLKVYTTIDLRLQRLARTAIHNRLAAPGSPSSALVSMDPKTGYIRAMASSSNYGDSKFNLATQGERQPGSTFKIIVLMTAIRRGVDINSTSYVSKKLKFKDPTYGPIDVDNSDGATSGKSKSLFQAVVTSDNTVFQQLDLDLGPPNVTKTAYDMGITTKLGAGPKNLLASKGIPAEGIGGLRTGVNPLQMARAYATINNGGSRVKPIAVTRVVLPGGKVDKRMGKIRRFRVFTDGETYEAIQAMKGNVSGGTGSSAQLPGCTAAGKTGTTSEFKDAWFDGMTRGLNTAVWVGYPGPEGKTLDNVPPYGRVFGGTAPALIWHDYMIKAVRGKNCGDWPQPKTPFVAQPFYGRLLKNSSLSGSAEGEASQLGVPGATGGGTRAPAAGSAAGGGTDPATGGGGDAGATDKGADGTGKGGGDGADKPTKPAAGKDKYPPSQYEAPPQPTPSTPSTQPASPTGGADAG